MPENARGKPLEIWFQMLCGRWPAGHADARVGEEGNEAPRDQRYKWAYILGAACPARQAATALVLPCADAETFSPHLAEISKQVAPGAHAVLVADGAGYHIAVDLKMPDNVTLPRLPPYSPQLNPMENVWAYLRANKLAITVFDDYDHIVAKSCQAWSFFATDPAAIASITTRSWAEVSL